MTPARIMAAVVVIVVVVTVARWVRADWVWWSRHGHLTDEFWCPVCADEVFDYAEHTRLYHPTRTGPEDNPLWGQV